MKNKSYYQANRLRDIRELVRRSERKYGSKAAYKQIGPDKKIQEFSFSRLYNDMNAIGTELLYMGMKDVHCAILGENSYEWVVSYLSVINGIGVAVPIDKELMADDISMLINKSDCEVLFCSNTYLNTALEVQKNSPDLKTIIVFNPKEAVEGVYSLPEIIERGYIRIKDGDSDYIDEYIDINKMCQIVFTSGTTGANKGVMLSQNNLVSVVYADMRLISPGEVSLSVLPINHTYECSCHILGGIYCGLTVCFNDSLKHVMANLKKFQPSFSIMVPMFLESMMRQINKKVEANHLENHTKWGIRYSNFIRKFGMDYRKVFFDPILKEFGGNLNQIVCGGAPLRKDIIDFFDSIGINVINGYGITECAPLVAAHISFDVHKSKFGSVGRVIPGCSVRIADKNSDGIGEIEVKGDNVMLGYYKDEAATKASFTDDGWFITGDRGYIDKDGYMYLSGRDKNLIILPNGKNVHPEEIEEKITTSLPFVEEVVVFSHNTESGEQTEICGAFYLNPDYVKENAIEDKLAFIKGEMKKINSKLPRYKQINQFYIVESEFEKTTTKKIKRQLVERRVFNNV